MKRISTIFAGFALALAALSCNKQFDRVDTNPDYYSFVTVQKEGNTVSRFVTDDGRTLVPKNVKSLNLADGQRLVIFFDLVNQADKDAPDAEIRLLGMDTDVEIGTSAVVADRAAATALGDNGTSINYYPNRPQVSAKYFNIYVGYNADKPEAHDFTLAYIEDEADASSKVLELVLCHNDNGDTSEREWWTWVSLPIEEFADLYKGKEKVRINIKTRMNGIQSVELPVPSLGSSAEPSIISYER